MNHNWVAKVSSHSLNPPTSSSHGLVMLLSILGELVRHFVDACGWFLHRQPVWDRNTMKKCFLFTNHQQLCLAGCSSLWPRRDKRSKGCFVQTRRRFDIAHPEVLELQPTLILGWNLQFVTVFSPTNIVILLTKKGKFLFVFD